MDTMSSPLMWRYERWRCEYEPASGDTGRLVVYSEDEPVLELLSVPAADSHARALALRALTVLATNRLSGSGEGTRTARR